MSNLVDSAVFYNYKGPEISVSSAGCGCCSDSESFYDKDKAIMKLEELIHDHKEQAKEYEAWIERIKAADRIVE